MSRSLWWFVGISLAVYLSITYGVSAPIVRDDSLGQLLNQFSVMLVCLSVCLSITYGVSTPIVGDDSLGQLLNQLSVMICLFLT